MKTGIPDSVLSRRAGVKKHHAVVTSDVGLVGEEYRSDTLPVRVGHLLVPGLG